MYRKIINETQQEKSLFKPKYNKKVSDTEGLNKAYTNGKGYYLDNNKFMLLGHLAITIFYLQFMTLLLILQFLSV